MTETRPTLLVVDDVVSNVDILLDTLSDAYNVRVATNGTAALDSVKKSPPDLILLDIMMPGMDGFEVCLRLKSDPDTRDVPIIFVTALNEDVDEARGLVLGGVDYIIKPFNRAIVLARVHNHLELKKHRDQLAWLVKERTQMLTEALNRLRALDAAQLDYLHAISHELRTPMNSVLGVAELALEDLSEEQRREYTAIYEPSRKRLLMAVDSALLLAELQGEGASLPTLPVDLAEIVATSAQSLQEAFPAKALSLSVPQAQPVLVLGNEEFLRQGITTLLKTALKMASADAPVAVQFGEDHDRAILQLVFKGQPLPDKLQSTFFDTFSYDRSSSCVEELGLAIPLAAHVIRAMGGTVDLRDAAAGVEIHLTFLKVPNKKE
jgi:CheY-like chemotaxis protein